VLIEVPMEPLDYPHQDPGYNALLTAYDGAQNLDRLDWIMAQATGYTGMIGRMGGRFAASQDAMMPVLDDVAKRGLLYIDNRSTSQTVVPNLAGTLKLPYAPANRIIDADPSAVEIERKLADLEELAVRSGSAVGLASGSRLTLQTLTQWAAALPARGIVLAPASAVAVIPSPDAPPAAAPFAQQSSGTAAPASVPPSPTAQ
jgi:polysaccharide deacetylase 2 family uncharacterized protein YibQ